MIRHSANAADTPSPRARFAETGPAWLFLGASVLAAAVALVYLPAAHGPFVFDDEGTIVDNPSIRQLWPLRGSNENPGPLIPSEGTAVHGRPLVSLSLAINYHFGRLDPYGYRLVNTAIHLLSAMLLWAVLTRTLRLEFFEGRFERSAGPLAFAAALLWALHPLNTESVVYVTQRTELMMGMFYLATLYGAIRHWAAEGKPRRAAWLTLAVAGCLAGMLSKEMMASAPAMVLLYQRTFITGTFRRALKNSWPLYVGLTLAWIPLVALNLNGPRTPSSGFGMGVAAHEWWFTQAKVVFLYLKLAVWPWPLVIHYEIPYVKTITEAWPWLLLTGSLAFAVSILAWRRSPVGFVGVWFFAVLSPTLVVPLITETAAERRMYVPLAALVPLLLAGAYILLQAAWRSFAGRWRARVVFPVPAAVLVVAATVLSAGFGWLSGERLTAYRTELGLWRDASRHQPHDPMVQFNLGTLLAEAGRHAESIRHLEQSVRLDPDSAQAHYNLARALEDVGQPEEAARHYRAALQQRPDDAASHYNLGRLLEDSGRLQRAIDHYRKAIAAQPEFAAAHANLGILQLNAGHTQPAIEHFEAALREQEDCGNWVNLAMAYAMAGRLEDAIPLAEKALAVARNENEAAIAKQALVYLKSQKSNF